MAELPEESAASFARARLAMAARDPSLGRVLDRTPSQAPSFLQLAAQNPACKLYRVYFFTKNGISGANPLTGRGAIIIMPRAEEIHSAKAHVVDRRRIVKRGH